MALEKDITLIVGALPDEEHIQKFINKYSDNMYIYTLNNVRHESPNHIILDLNDKNIGNKLRELKNKFNIIIIDDYVLTIINTPIIKYLMDILKDDGELVVNRNQIQIHHLGIPEEDLIKGVEFHKNGGYTTEYLICTNTNQIYYPYIGLGAIGQKKENVGRFFLQNNIFLYTYFGFLYNTFPDIIPYFSPLLRDDNSDMNFVYWRIYKQPTENIRPYFFKFKSKKSTKSKKTIKKSTKKTKKSQKKTKNKIESRKI